MSLIVWAVIRHYASERAKKRYPKQPERARQMADHECGIYDGPYKLEPLTLPQRIGLLLGLAEYEQDPREISFTDGSDMSWSWKRQLRHAYKVLTTGKY